MSKLNLLGLESQREAMLKSLMALGAVDISVVDDEIDEGIAKNPIVQDDLSRIEGELAKVTTALNSLNQYCPEKKGMFQTRRVITMSELEKISQNQQVVWQDVEKIKQQEERLVSLKSDENRLDNLRLSLMPWKDLSAPLQTGGTQKTVFQYGTIPSVVSWDLLEAEFDEKVPYSLLKKVDSDREQHYLFILTHADVEQECLSFLKSRGYNRVTFPGLTGSVSGNIDRINDRLKALTAERENCTEEIKAMADARKPIEVLHDALMMEKGRIEATAKVLTTKKAFFIKGWIPTAVASDAKKQLESKYTVSIDIHEPDKDEEYPVLLQNKGIAEAGEPVSRMYSLPSSLEIDPNAVMSPFFILFFGLMLGDGGYGIIMTAATGFALWRLKLDDTKRKFVKLLFFCGIATIFWGAMFGSWFGISGLVQYALWMDIVANPELMLSWALLFGIIHLFAGFAMKAANLIREKKYLDALFDVGFWYIFYTGAVLCLLPYAPAVPLEKTAALASIGPYVLVVGAVLVLLTAGRAKKNVIGKVFGGLLSLYDVVGFLSDVLSYSRLLALGLATAIIASIVNQMSAMFDMPIVLKGIVAVLILVVGHTVNFAINALGAYVHSCRLQYLEFFGKFFTGGGKAFNPLKANTKYITVKPDAGM